MSNVPYAPRTEILRFMEALHGTSTKQIKALGLLMKAPSFYRPTDAE